MTDRTLSEQLDRLVEHEPPMTLTVDPVVESGRRIRRRHRRVVVASSAAMAVAAAAVAVPLLARGGSGGDRLAVSPFAMTGTQAQSAGDPEPQLTAKQQAVVDAVEKASPGSYTFDFSADRWDDSAGVEGTVDDGTGPGRLMIGISRDPGTQLLHPCKDSEFNAGASCTERVLDDGSVLTLRGLIDYKGIRYVDVVLTHPDGGGVMAEAGNFVIDWPPPRVITADEKRNLVHPSRDDPVYSPAALSKVVVAIDNAING
jgi:hypothetical protein